MIDADSSYSDVMVQGVDRACSYEISIVTMESHIVNVLNGRRYPVSMGMQGTVSFLYEHSSDRSFKIVQMINTGRFNIYVTPIVNKTLP